MSSKKPKTDKSEIYKIVQSGQQEILSSDDTGAQELKYTFSSNTNVDSHQYEGSPDAIAKVINNQARNQEEQKDRELDREFRSEYAPKVFELINMWLFLVAFFLLMSGFTDNVFELDDTVLVALVAGLSAGIVSLLAIVLYWMFPRRDKSGSNL